MRKLAAKPIKKQFTIRKVKLEELSEDDRQAIEKGLADSEAGRVTPMQVKNPKGFKVTATDRALDTLRGINVGDILQHIVNHEAARRRRKNTKAKIRGRVSK